MPNTFFIIIIIIHFFLSHTFELQLVITKGEKLYFLLFLLLATLRTPKCIVLFKVLFFSFFTLGKMVKLKLKPGRELKVKSVTSISQFLIKFQDIITCFKLCSPRPYHKKLMGSKKFLVSPIYILS